MTHESNPIPPHVQVMRRVALMTIGVSETILIFGPLLARAYSAALGSMDAGDWIAVGAVVVATVGIWFARRSAQAAERSAQTARDALAIARDSAGSAATSARAAEKSADADSRMATIAEDAHHQSRAPKWTIQVDPPDREKCVVRFWYEGGPNQISINATVNATAWAGPNEHGVLDGYDIFETHVHNSLHRNEYVTVSLRLAVGQVVELVEMVVSITSAESRQAAGGPLQQPWIFVEARESPRRVQPMRIRKINFKRS